MTEFPFSFGETVKMKRLDVAKKKKISSLHSHCVCNLSQPGDLAVLFFLP